MNRGDFDSKFWNASRQNLSGPIYSHVIHIIHNKH
jgi:hypothetical protein